MKQTISQYDFIQAFRDYDRYDEFGYLALVELFDYLEELEEDTSQEFELDVIALCCDYAVEDFTTIAQNYSIDIAGMADDEARAAVLEFLNDNTTVVSDDCDGKILYAANF